MLWKRLVRNRLREGARVQDPSPQAGRSPRRRDRRWPDRRDKAL